ncbi:MAG TPA: hypothetical protein VK196_17055 [Magnetospirillum sp.]|nr:hypothetical protein [Magnetospirillum sp.]
MQVLTLSEARTRDAKERVTTAALDLFKSELKAKLLSLVAAEYAASEFAWIADPDLKVLDAYLAQGLDDCCYDAEMEIES